MSCFLFVPCSVLLKRKLRENSVEVTETAWPQPQWPLRAMPSPHSWAVTALTRPSRQLPARGAVYFLQERTDVPLSCLWDLILVWPSPLTCTCQLLKAAVDKERFQSSGKRCCAGFFLPAFRLLPRVCLWTLMVVEFEVGEHTTRQAHTMRLLNLCATGPAADSVVIKVSVVKALQRVGNPHTSSLCECSHHHCMWGYGRELHLSTDWLHNLHLFCFIFIPTHHHFLEDSAVIVKNNSDQGFLLTLIILKADL